MLPTEIKLSKDLGAVIVQERNCMEMLVLGYMVRNSYMKVI